jgi:hypothetical protein
MPSPFPGMNPYLERASVWDSLHPNLITAAHFHLNTQVAPRYLVQIEARLYLHEPTAEQRFRWIGDLGVKPGAPREPNPAPATATVAPAYVTLADTVQTERVQFLTIRDRESRELVTVIELLSPTNKYAGPDRAQYLTKRLELLRSNTHFVELDLLRGGPRMPPDDLPTCDYCALVSRVEERPRAGVWPWRVRDALPVIPIPLRGGDADATLNLKAVLDQVYDGGGYHYLAYTGPPEPRLAPDDAAWAAQYVPASSGTAGHAT